MSKKSSSRDFKHNKEVELIVNQSRIILMEQAKKKLLNYHEFVQIQMRQIKKRWWIFQVILLVILGLFINSNQDMYYIDRSLSVSGVLFVVLLIPELWKNTQYKCMEIEMSSYFSIKQIYAARILVLGMIDILIIVFFGGIAYCVWKIPFYSIIFQFLLPMVVTACICFKTLERQRVFNSTVTVIICLIWSTLWWGITSIEFIYEKIRVPILLVMLLGSLIFLCISIINFLKNCNNYWEESTDGISFKKR